MQSNILNKGVILQTLATSIEYKEPNFKSRREQVKEVRKTGLIVAYLSLKLFTDVTQSYTQGGYKTVIPPCFK